MTSDELIGAMRDIFTPLVYGSRTTPGISLPNYPEYPPSLGLDLNIAESIWRKCGLLEAYGEDDIEVPAVIENAVMTAIKRTAAEYNPEAFYSNVRTQLPKSKPDFSSIKTLEIKIEAQLVEDIANMRTTKIHSALATAATQHLATSSGPEQAPLPVISSYRPASAAQSSIADDLEIRPTHNSKKSPGSPG